MGKKRAISKGQSEPDFGETVLDAPLCFRGAQIAIWRNS